MSQKQISFTLSYCEYMDGVSCLKKVFFFGMKQLKASPTMHLIHHEIFLVLIAVL